MKYKPFQRVKLKDKCTDTESEESEKITEYEKVLEIAKSVFRPEQVIDDKENQCIIIHFPTIDMTNSRNEKHTIHDMYVSFSIDNVVSEDSVMVVKVDMSAIRTTFTLAEVKTNFMHSHINSGSFLTWSPFCMGSGTPFAIMVMNISYVPTRDNWELLFLSLERFLAWESIEGTPYMSMRYIKIGAVNDNVALEDELNRMMPTLTKDVMMFDDRPYFEINHQFITWVNNNSRIRDISQIDEDNIKALIDSEINKLKLKEKQYIDVGGKQVEVKIIMPETKEGDIKIKKPVTLDILNKYCTLLNKNCNNYTKIIGYGRAKANQETFGEVGII